MLNNSIVNLVVSLFFLLNRELKKVFQFFRYYYYSFWRSRISFFEYDKFLEEMPLYSRFESLGSLGNRAYGNYFALKRYLQSDFEEDCVIEHGIYFGRYANLLDLSPCPKVIYTFGLYRYETLKLELGLSSVRVICVGPYIRYCRGFYTEKDLKLIKNKLGRVLTVFPYHTSELEGYSSNENNFLDEILRYSKDFDSVLLCMFWLDILKLRHELYKVIPNLVIVCAGTRNDPFFLSRLKNVIELSDMTITNGLGTHLGYCVSLGKPVYYFYQEKEYLMDESIAKHYPQDYQFKLSQEEELFVHSFGNYSMELSEDQKSLVEYFWG